MLKKCHCGKCCMRMNHKMPTAAPMHANLHTGHQPGPLHACRKLRSCMQDPTQNLRDDHAAINQQPSARNHAASGKAQQPIYP